MNKLQMMEQIRKTIQIFAASLDVDKAMEIATVYDPWEIGKAYALGEYVTHGTNGVGDPQLYKIVQAHTSQSDWLPADTPSLYKPIGLTPQGYSVWSRPSGAHDAYNIGDIVDYNGTLYKSIINGNKDSPDEYPAGWEIINL